MFRSIITLIVLIAAVEAGERVYQGMGFSQLERYLYDNLGKTKDVEANLEKALAKKRSVATKLGMLDNDFRYALMELEKLAKVWKNPQCDDAQYEILKTFADTTNGHEYYENPDEELNLHLDYIVNQISLVHTRKCMSFYPKSFLSLYEKIEPAAKKLVEGFKSDYLERKSGMSYVEYQGFLINFAKTYEKNRADVDKAVEYIRTLGGIGSDWIEYYSKYLQQPCESYTSGVCQPNINMAFFDAEMFADNTAFKLDENDANLTLFYRAAVHCRICQTIQYNDIFKNEVLFGLKHIYKNAKRSE